MNVILFFSTLVFAILVSCTSFSKKQGLRLSPLNSYKVIDSKKSIEEIEMDLNKVLAESPEDPSTQWWVTYKRAQAYQESNSNLSCSLFTTLSNDIQFPLHRLAQLRAIHVCEDKDQKKQIFSVKLSKDEDWLEGLYEDKAYLVAKELKDHEQIMRYALDQSKESRISSQKVAFTEEALRSAKKINNKEMQTYLEKRRVRLAPRLSKSIQRKDWLKVAYDNRRAREFEKAKYYYKRVLNHSKSSYNQKKKAFQGIIKTYKIQNDVEKYILASRQWSNFAKRYYRQNKKSSYFRKEHYNTNLKVARTLWTKNQVSEARRLIETTIKTLKGRTGVQEAYWILARMEEEKGNFKEAIDFANLALKEPKDSNEILDKVLWLKAWNVRKLERYQEAAASYEELLKNTEEEHLQNKYAFWLGKTYKDLKQESKAKDTFEELIKNDPMGYYGTLAYNEIGKDIPHLRPKKPFHLEKQNLQASKSQESILKWLIATNELEVAKDYLKKLPIYKMNDSDQVKYLSYYKLAQDYRGLFVRMASFDKERRNELLDIDAEFFFPRPFFDVIAAAAEKNGTSPELLLSIMRQESAFDPKARSHADAYGLMQVLPREAFRIAAKNNVPLHKTEDLYEPEVNIPIGAAHVKHLWDRFNGQFIISIASYNAAYKAVHGWLRTRYQGDALTFIEDIPYAETKGYVKLIFRNFMVYKRLNYAMDKVPFPHWAFNSLDEYAENYAKNSHN